ncbi:glycosyltransferase [Elongatibacter sediminis]|uniref:Glycosyltransferase n=1 Tax=Elongatibacter sediminis TaxID=3119006 RepID=A0AAW9RB97_9GAMM
MSTSHEPLLSILIPTLDSRRELLDGLVGELERQAEHQGASTDVEILLRRDDGSEPVGAKRNRLLAAASGRFVVFVDDDDRVGEQYVSRILEAIRSHPAADCISLRGEIRFRGRHPRPLIHSVRYHDWRHCAGRYLRPPCHITPIRRDIAREYAFAEVDRAEDMDWSLRISRAGALRNEVLLDDVLYFYQCRQRFITRWFLDVSQPLRHLLGLKSVNLLALHKRAKPRVDSAGPGS